MMNQRYENCVFALIILLFCSSCGYMHKVYLRGVVTDVGGQTLPGVVVKIKDTEYEGLTDATGRYSFGATTGNLQVEFFKTGYTPAHIEVTVESLGRVEAPTVSLWPLPVSEGVYFCRNYRFYEAAHPRPNRYQVKDAGEAWGTPVNTDLIIPWADPQSGGEQNPPFMVGHKVPAYDARMHKMKKVNAALIQMPNRLSADQKPEKEMQYPEEIWVAEQAIEMYSKVLDEPEKLLVELRAAAPLSPGVYAIHWGALEGYDSIDPRIFMFELREPIEESVEGEGETDGVLPQSNVKQQ